MSGKKREGNFCSPEDYSIIIPYKDFEKLVLVAREVEEMKKLYARIEERCAAMQNMFSECLEKVAEIYRLL